MLTYNAKRVIIQGVSCKGGLQMEYLTRVLGIHVDYKNGILTNLPNYIYSRYELKQVSLDGKDAVFVYPKVELDSVNAVKKHIDKISQISGTSAILVLDTLTYRYKEYLLRDHIPFIVDNKQIYLPFLALYLQERCDSEPIKTSELLPSAQMLLLYFIYNGCREIPSSKAARDLELTSTSISRASRQLVELKLLQSKAKGVHKMLFSDKTPEELFRFSKNYLFNPVKRTIYINKSDLSNELPLSSYTALSEYTMLSPSSITIYATDSIASFEKNSSTKLNNSTEQCAIELWRYNPIKLSNGKCVDKLSLALALSEDQDERTEESVDEMLAQTWREIYGKRD